MIQGFRSQAEEKHITLGHEVTPISLTINADPRRVKRILLAVIADPLRLLQVVCRFSGAPLIFPSGPP